MPSSSQFVKGGLLKKKKMVSGTSERPREIKRQKSPRRETNRSAHTKASIDKLRCRDSRVPDTKECGRDLFLAWGGPRAMSRKLSQNGSIETKKKKDICGIIARLKQGGELKKSKG